MKKTFTPRPRHENVRVFVALFITFVILLTPVAPLRAAPAVTSNPSSTDLKRGEALEPQPATAIISATKTDSFADPNNDGKAEPGDVITYDVNVQNSGASDATGVTFTDTIDANTTLVPGSLRVSPLAFADSYGATVDSPLNISAPGVLINDTGTPAPTAAPIAGGPTTAGGTVTLNADGSFTYNPPSGFTGTDTFTYTVTNGLSPDDTATVTINVDVGPSVTTTSPANGTNNVAQNSNITVNFSESVNATASSFTIECPTGSPQSFSLSPSPSNSFTLDPTADLPAGTTCTVTVVASQITDADTIDPPDQMAANYVFSFGTKPLAVDDMRSATGNVRIDSSRSNFSVLDNDQGAGISVTSFDATSAQGGQVTMTGGTFTYNPPRGFTGPDSFNYTISNGAGSDQGTVVITVSDMIWFIDNTSGACSSSCDGRLTNPYTSLAVFEAVNGSGGVGDPEAGDNIFIYSGTGNYTAPLTLENNQKVIGQGASGALTGTGSLTGITPAPDSDPLPSTGGTKPILTTVATSGNNGVTLASDNEVYGLAFLNTEGAAIRGAVDVGLLVIGDIAITNTSGPGVSLTNGGTVTSTAVNTISTTTGTALNVVNTNIGSGNLTFRSISSTGAPNGINLDNTGAGGGLIVTGNSAGTCGGTVTPNAPGVPATVTPPNIADCTGGTILNSAGTDGSTAGIGIRLNNTRNVSLTRMHVTGSQNYGIKGDNVTNLSLTSCLFAGANGNNNVNREGAAAFDNLFGASAGSNTITNSSFTGSLTHGLRVSNTSGTLNSLVITGSSLTTTNASGVGEDGMQIEGTAATMTVSVSNSLFSLNEGDHFQVTPSNNAVINVSFQNNTLLGDGMSGSPTTLGGGITLNSAINFTGTLTFNVSNNTFRGTTAGSAINISKGGPGLFSGTINNNFIGQSGVPLSGCAQNCSGVNLTNQHRDSDLVVAVTNNNIRNVTQNGIRAMIRDTNIGVGLNNTFSITVKGNTIAEPNNNPPFSAVGRAIAVEVVSGTDTPHVCADIGGAGALANTISGTWNSGGDSIRVVTRTNTASFRLPGYVGGIHDEAAAAAYLTGRNTAPGGAIADVNPNATGTGFTGGAPCTAPLASNFTETEQREELAQANDVSQAAASSDEVLTSHSSNVAASRATQPMAQRSTTFEMVKSQPVASALAAPASLMPSGETVTATIGTLPAGKTVRIQFQVTVANPFTGSPAQVSNQGTVSGSNFANVLTDDPTVGGSADPTVTPILTPPTISIKDASAVEPTSGSSTAAFTVALSHAYSQTVTVDFSTAPDTGGANPATAGSDYTVTSGTLTFSPGQTLQTVSVPVLADADGAEVDETFLVNLSGATNGSLSDGQATGTIRVNDTPGTVIISELRTSGPGGVDDDFVELLNNTDSDIDISGWSLAKMGSTCSDTPVIIAAIPSGTVIPARGNYLVVGSTYSLGLYATGNKTMGANIEDGENIALFDTADIGNYQTSTRRDAVGFGANTGNNCDLLREGSTLQPAGNSMSEYSFVRNVDKGETLDTNNNSADFRVVSTTPLVPVGTNTPTLGAPGPESSSSPRGPIPCNVEGATTKLDRSRLDSSVGVGAAPNTVRDNTADAPNNSSYGTLDFRRRFTNSTGGSITRLRYRIVNLTTTLGAADLRARSSVAIPVNGVNDTTTCGGSAPCNVVVQGTTLETPPVQGSGGGVNSSLSAGTVTLGTPLAAGASVNLHFLFGVEQEGDYQIGIVIETLTSGDLGQDIWVLRGNTQTGGHTDGGCNTPPIADAGTDQTVECAGASTSVMLDGSASSDPDGDTPLTYEWREGATVLGTTATLNTSLAFGPHTITLKVGDPSGDFTEDTVSVNVADTADPIFTSVPPNVSVNTGAGATSCSAFVSDEVLGAATATDGCAGDLPVTRSGVPAGNIFPVGQTTITYSADDGHGHVKNAYQVVTVTDNTPPVLNVPANQTVNAPADSCSANVDPGTATATDNCSVQSVVGVRSDHKPLNASYPVGTTTITWTATDASNNTTVGNQTITVKDVQPPVITLTTGALVIGPPNHSYETLAMSQLVASASDLCDAGVNINDVVITKVTSDEAENANGNGDGNTVNDIVVAPDCKSLQLRRERAGGGDGRVYTITLAVADSSGNVTTATRKVFVPSGSSMVDSGAQYTVNGCTP